MGSSLSRRGFLTGTSLLLPTAPALATPTIIARKQELVINPWRHQRSKDAAVTPAQVGSVRYIYFGPDHKDNWLEVHTLDGRFIQTELREHQGNIDAIGARLKTWGFSITRVNVNGGFRKFYERAQSSLPAVKRG